MKKIIILGIAVLSTGIVVSRNLKKEDAPVKPTIAVSEQKAIITNKDVKAPSYDAVGTAD